MGRSVFFSHISFVDNCVATKRKATFARCCSLYERHFCFFKEFIMKKKALLLFLCCLIALSALVCNGCHTHSFTNYVSDWNSTYDADGTKTAKCDDINCTATDTIIDDYSMFIPTDSSAFIFKDGVITGLTETGKSLPEIVIPYIIEVGNEKFAVMNIGSEAFKNCTSLNKIAFPETIIKFGKDAFMGCNSLTHVNFCGEINQWAQIEFENEFSNPIYYSKNLILKDTLLTKATINAQKINTYAFFNCRSLKEIYFQNSVEEISSYSFANCISAEKIAIPKNVTKIEEYAFFNCINSTIYCEAQSAPNGWNKNWDYYNRNVVWEYQINN